MLVTSSAHVRMQVLGPVRVSSNGGRPATTFLTRPRPLSVLLYLTLARPRGLHARDTLIAMFWPEADHEGGRHALRNALHSIRLTLGDELLVTEGDSLVGVGAARLECDALLLEADLGAGNYDEAINRYDGELLQGFHVSGAPEFERWLDGERRRLRDAVLSAAWHRAEEYRVQGNLRGAIEIARRALALAPDDEPTLRRLLPLLLDDGDHSAAIRAYESFAQRMVLEYQADPAPETMQLLARARAGSSSRLPVNIVRSQDARPTHDSEAYILYVRGNYLFLRAAHGGHAEDLLESRVLFEQALERDPNFALAHAGLSNFYSVGATRNLLRPFHTHFNRAIEISRHTLALDPSQAIPHVHFGVKAMYLDSDWEAAEREFACALALDPRYAETQRFYGVYLGAMGKRVEGIEYLREAVRLEPQIAIYRNALAAAYMDERDYGGAIEQLRRALELDPRYAAARDRLIRCYERLELFDEAIRERRAHGGVVDDFAIALEAEGADGYRRVRARELRATIQTLEERVQVDPPENASDLLNPVQIRIALAFAELGEWDRARFWEEQLCSVQPGRRQWFVTHPDLAPLHTRDHRSPCM